MSDDVIWHIIQNTCSFITKTQTSKFCNNTYNVTGKCNRESCPLANGRYATVKVEDNIVYLYIKEPERVSTPNRWWEKIKLKANKEQAMEQIEKHLIYWPKHRVKKIKQRYFALVDYVKRKRKIENENKIKITAHSKKFERLENRKEYKALKAADIKKTVSNELISRLNTEFMNIDEELFNQYLEKEAIEEEEEEVELVEMSSDEEIEEDIEELTPVIINAKPSTSSKKQSKPKKHITIEDDD